MHSECAKVFQADVRHIATFSLAHFLNLTAVGLLPNLLPEISAFLDLPSLTVCFCTNLYSSINQTWAYKVLLLCMLTTSCAFPTTMVCPSVTAISIPKRRYLGSGILYWITYLVHTYCTYSNLGFTRLFCHSCLYYKFLFIFCSIQYCSPNMPI